MKDERHVWLAIRSDDMTNERISELVGLTPSKVRAQGVPTPPSRVPAKHNEWRLDSGISKFESLEKHANSLLEVVGGNENSISLLSDEGHTVQFGCAIYTNDYNIMPYLSHRTVEAIARLKADLYFDIYSLRDDDAQSDEESE